MTMALVLAMTCATIVMAAIDNERGNSEYIEITNNGEVIEFVNKPFIENDEVYLPLREMFEKLNVVNDIKWNDGKIDIRLANFFNPYQNNEITDASKEEFFYEIEIDNANIVVNPNSNISYSLDLVYVPILKNNITYIPFPYLDYMLSQLGNEECRVICNSWDKRNGGNINREADHTSVQGTIFNSHIYELYNIYGDARDVTYSFFDAFSQREFDTMKNYCTQNCINTFFGDGYVFGMKEASLANIKIDPMEYAKSSNDFNIFVTVDMIPHENSIFDISRTQTSFYVILQRQTDGGYLIDEFATGL